MCFGRFEGLKQQTIENEIQTASFWKLYRCHLHVNYNVNPPIFVKTVTLLQSNSSNYWPASVFKSFLQTV